MPRKCCVPGCKSNYYSTIKLDGAVSTFSFPKDEARKQMWLSAIQRKNWQPTSSSSCVCANHFEEKDIILYDKWKQRDGTVKNLLLRFPKLSKTAVPCKFSNFPLYLSSSTSSYGQDSESGVEDTRKQIEQREFEVQKQTIVSDFSDFLVRMTFKLDPGKWQHKLGYECVWFYLLNIDVSENITSELSVVCTVIVNKNLNVKVFLKNSEVLANNLNDVFPEDPVLRNWSQLHKLLSKFYYLSCHFVEIDTIENCLKRAKSALNKAVELAEYEEFCNKNTLQLVND